MERIKTLAELNLSERRKLDLIGTRAFHRNRYGAFFPVKIIDHKYAYGIDRYMVEPVGGRGSYWTQDRTLTLEI